MCGLRANKLNSSNQKEMLILSALKRLENEKDYASAENIKFKERSNRILSKLFDENRKSEGGTFSIIREILIEEFKEMMILDEK